VSAGLGECCSLLSGAEVAVDLVTAEGDAQAGVADGRGEVEERGSDLQQPGALAVEAGEGEGRAAADVELEVLEVLREDEDVALVQRVQGPGPVHFHAARQVRHTDVLERARVVS
jgi:hypothetical protein